MASYNGAKYIREQVDSILRQLGAQDELIVSDDGSTDGTEQIVKAIGDPRIRFISHNKVYRRGYSVSHKYTSANFENALYTARGEYIFLSDQDDIWLDGRVEKMIAALADHLLVMGNMSVIDSDGALKKDRYFERSPIHKCWLVNLNGMPFFGCCLAFRRELLDWALPFPRSLVPHDNWLGILAVKQGSVAFLDEPLLLYRRHRTNVSKSSGQSDNPLWYKLWYRMVFLGQLCRRIVSRNIG